MLNMINHVQCSSSMFRYLVGTNVHILRLVLKCIAATATATYMVPTPPCKPLQGGDGKGNDEVGIRTIPFPFLGPLITYEFKHFI